MNDKYEKFSFSVNEIKEYNKELKEIKTVYDDLIKDKAVTKILETINKEKQIKLNYNKIIKDRKKYSKEIENDRIISLNIKSNCCNLGSKYKIGNGFC